jgi:hypothetical protein
MFTNLVTTVLAEAPEHAASKEMSELIVGAGCIVVVIVIALFWAYKK